MENEDEKRRGIEVQRKMRKKSLVNTPITMNLELQYHWLL